MCVCVCVTIFRLIDQSIYWNNNTSLGWHPGLLPHRLLSSAAVSRVFSHGDISFIIIIKLLTSLYLRTILKEWLDFLSVVESVGHYRPKREQETGKRLRLYTFILSLNGTELSDMTEIETY